MKAMIIGMILAFLMIVGIATATTVTMDSASGPGTSFDNQYIYNYDYSGATVTVTYNSPDTNLKAHIVATGLKPLFTYQVKIEGQGSLAATGGERLTNERIGMSGRWWDGGNQNDAYYTANKDTKNVIGYLVFDSFTTDASGNWEGDVETDASYHVLFCNDVGLDNGDLYSVAGVPEYSSYILKCDSSVAKLCPAASVKPQIERPSFTALPEGDYTGVHFILNEESFHVVCGTWTTAMTEPISFTIARIPTPVCGNGVVETGEKCDDGNLINFDGCSASCGIEDTSNTLINPSTNKPIGTVTTSQCGADFGANLIANGLTPSSLYQVKLEGKPTCSYGPEGNDVANENIGMQGRFWCTSYCEPACTIIPAWGGCNIDNKVAYAAQKSVSGFCAKGYILFKCINSDSSGNIATDISGVTTSYEYCPAVMGSADLPNGNYNLKLLLGENFGNWNTVGTQFLSFNIGDCDNDGDPDVTDCNDNDPAIYHGAADVVCNGVDNDCDGSTDEDYISLPTTCGVGACSASGSTSCVAGSVLDSCTAGTPTTEVCNGIDDDCDGTTDEGTQNTCGTGAFTDGWADCAVSGSNYGGIGSGACKVAWNGVTQVCIEDTRDATFTVGVEGLTTTKLIINHLDGIAETTDSFTVLDGTTVLCRFDDLTSGSEVWKTLTCDVNFVGVKTLTLHPLAPGPWSLCTTYGQVAISGIAFEAAPTTIDFKEGYTCSDGWGVPAIPGGAYGGKPYSEFCLVWEPTCAADTKSASVNLAFAGGTESITISHLDGMSNLDSFDVLVDDILVGHYTDSLNPTENWIITAFPVNVVAGIHTVTLKATDNAWNQCDSWGQLAVDYIEECVPLTFYQDSDADTYGNTLVTIQACSAPTGYVADSTDCNDASASVHPGAAEVCNGIDDDCDGTTDEDYISLPTTCGVGACSASGSTSCVAGSVLDSCTAGTPTTETCNGVDDDCDDSIDESLTRTTHCGLGVCSKNKGIETCAAGVWGDNTCNPFAGATTEVCDDKDNNCDGKTDESPCTAAAYCGSINIRSGAGSISGILRCITADWQKNEPSRFPNDCRINLVSYGRSFKLVCVATPTAN